MTSVLAPIRTAAPTEAPISLAEAKAHLRVESGEDDDLIRALIDAATSHFDGWSGLLGRALITQTWRADFGCWADPLRLPLAPVQSAVVKYSDPDGIEHTIDAAAYHLNVDALGPRITRASGTSWPALADRPDAVRVTFIAGYGTAADVPMAIRQAMLLLVGHWYRSREPVNIGNIVNELPFTVESLVATFRRVGV